MSNNTAISEAEKLGLIKTVEPVEHFIANGLESALTQKLGCRISMSSASDGNKTANDHHSKQLKYPFGVATLLSYTIPSDKGNSRATALRGEIAVVESNEKKSFVVKYVPVTMEYDLEVRCNSHGSVLDVARRLVFARVLSGFIFNVQYGKHSFGVKALPADSISIPQRNAEITEVQEYVLKTSLTVHGFVSLPELMEQQIAEAIDIVGQLSEVDPETGDNRIIYSTSTAPNTAQLRVSPSTMIRR